MKKLIAAAALGLVFANAVFAQTSPVGLWKTVDDDGKTAKSLVRITESGGTLSGTVEKVFDTTKQDVKCDKCTDERKDRPVLGMTIIRGVKQEDDKATWSGGEILDPANGKTYKTKIWSEDGGKTLNVRGYIGFLYRTQVWQKAE